MPNQYRSLREKTNDNSVFGYLNDRRRNRPPSTLLVHRNLSTLSARSQLFAAASYTDPSIPRPMNFSRAQTKREPKSQANVRHSLLKRSPPIRTMIILLQNWYRDSTLTCSTLCYILEPLRDPYCWFFWVSSPIFS